MPQTEFQMSNDMQQCIDECVDCARACIEATTSGLLRGNRHAEAEHIRLLLDCAEICETSAHFMLRGSDLHVRTCELCAEICELCATHCDGFGDDPQVRACADACRRCAASCRKMARVPRRAAA